jgi:predicted nucleic acid-binding protein
VSGVLLDTNIAVRLVSVTLPEHPLVLSSVTKLITKGEPLCLAAQVLINLWVVATRPATSNGLGWTLAQTDSALDGLLAQFPLLIESPAVFASWRSFVKAGVAGKRDHDARLAAVAKANGVSRILTLNKADFDTFAGIVPIHPSEVI